MDLPVSLRKIRVTLPINCKYFLHIHFSLRKFISYFSRKSAVTLNSQFYTRGNSWFSQLVNFHPFQTGRLIPVTAKTNPSTYYLVIFKDGGQSFHNGGPQFYR